MRRSGRRRRAARARRSKRRPSGSRLRSATSGELERRCRTTRRPRPRSTASTSRRFCPGAPTPGSARKSFLGSRRLSSAISVRLSLAMMAGAVVAAISRRLGPRQLGAAHHRGGDARQLRTDQGAARRPRGRHADRLRRWRRARSHGSRPAPWSPTQGLAVVVIHSFVQTQLSPVVGRRLGHGAGLAASHPAETCRRQSSPASRTR